MNDSASLNDVLDAVAKILLWCIGLGVVFILLWFAMLVFMIDYSYDFYSKFTEISKEQFVALCFQGMMLAKAAVIELFLFPYVGIVLVLRHRRQ